MRRVACVWLGACLLMGGCLSRERSNPFDPGNPRTHGRPSNLIAVAGDGIVDLEWESGGILDIEGFDIVRRTEAGDSIRLTPQPLPPGARAYRDGGLAAGITYLYTLAAYIEEQEEPVRGAEEAATPGPGIAWVMDPVVGYLWRISPDARDLVDGFSMQTGLADLLVEPQSGAAWLADRTRGALLRVSPDGGLSQIAGPAGVVAVASNADASRLFAGSYDTGDVYGYGSGHARIWADDSTCVAVEDLALSEADDVLWIADAGGKIVRLAAADGAPLSELGGFDRPFALWIQPGGGAAWLADAGQEGAVHKIAGDGSVILASTFAVSAPADVVGDAEGGCWVADYGAGRVIRFDADLAVRTSVAGFSAPRGLAVDPGTGDVWVAEAGTGRLVRISSGGEVVARVSGMASPSLVEVAWRPGRRAR
jgi:streptogramin lyase